MPPFRTPTLTLIFVDWECTAGGNCENVAVLSGHKNAILDCRFTNDSEKVIAASADNNLGVFDVATGERLKRFMGHSSIVNAVDVSSEASPALAVSASDDCTVKLWDARVRGETGSLEDEYQITAVAYSNDGNSVYRYASLGFLLCSIPANVRLAMA